MFEQIVVGVDGGPGGGDAVALAKHLLLDGGELTLAHVYAGDPRLYHSPGAAYEASARARAGDLLEQARQEAGVQAHLRWHEAPSVGRGLHELCEELDTDLLVVGSSRRGLLGRVLIGDDTRAALNGVPCAIAVAPAGYRSEPTAMREIGVGYDGSPESEHALQVGRELADELNARLSGFQATSLPATAYSGVLLPLGDAVQEMVDQAQSEIAALGDIEPHAAFGQPAEELALYSVSLDLLIVGSRGYGPLGRLIYGGTSYQLLRSARCPLLVLPRAATVAQANGRRAAGAAAVASYRAPGQSTHVGSAG